MNNTEVFITARKCSYDPMQDLIDVTYDNDKHSAYLQVPHRLIWFATYCAEKGFTGFVDDGDVKYIPELALMQATASVFINGTMVGRSSAGCAITAGDYESINNAIQTAATRAKGRALANAGFGTPPTMDGGNAAEDGNNYPCDGGIPFQYPQMVVSNGQVVQNPVMPPVNPMPYAGNPAPAPNPAPTQAPPASSFPFGQQQMQMPQPAPQQQPPMTYLQQPAPQSPMTAPVQRQAPVQQPIGVAGMTLEQAKAFVIPSGKMKGKVMGELDIDMVKWYAEKCKAINNPNLIVAAKLVLEEKARMLQMIP